MKFEFIESIGDLSEDEKLKYYQYLAHNLTVTIRVIWSDETIAENERLNRIKWTNEILHQVLNRVIGLTNKNDTKTEDEMWNTIKHWVSQNKEIAGNIGFALKSSYERLFYKPNGNP
jgi:hypothetical protein